LNKVSIIRVREDIEAVVRSSIDLVGGIDLNPGESVVLKPNICNAKNPRGIVNTDPRIIEAVVRILKDFGCKITVVESDNVSGPADKRVKESGYLKFFQQLDVDFLNLSRDDFMEYPVANTMLRIPLTVLNTDFFVNLPKIKTCAHTLVTLGIKNLYGVFQRSRKDQLHKYLDEILPLLAQIIRNDLIVVDGIRCMEGNGPVVGNPRLLNLVVSGKNIVSVDSVCSRIMGYDPDGISHIAFSSSEGLGPIDIREIEVVGANLRDFVDPFEPPYSLKANLKCLKSIIDVYLS
jgi:uncharacterized protein (DUF362 family)